CTSHQPRSGLWPMIGIRVRAGTLPSDENALFGPDRILSAPVATNATGPVSCGAGASPPPWPSVGVDAPPGATIGTPAVSPRAMTKRVLTQPLPKLVSISHQPPSAERPMMRP